MRKVIIFIIAIATCLSFVSCGGFDVDADGEIKTATFTVSCDYGTIEEGKVTLLLDGNLPFFELDDWGIDKLVVGDVITVEYTGDIFILETYPGTVSTKNATIKKITHTPAETQSFVVYSPDEEDAEALVAIKPEQEVRPMEYPEKLYIINDDLTFRELDTSDAEISRSVFGAYKNDTDDTGGIIEILALYASNPR